MQPLELFSLAKLSGWPLASAQIFLRRQRLPPGEHAELHVRVAADGVQVGDQLLIERFATFDERIVILRRRLQQVADFRAVFGPVRLEVGVEVADGNTGRRTPASRAG